jgi:hypothetical protein
MCDLNIITVSRISSNEDTFRFQVTPAPLQPKQPLKRISLATGYQRIDALYLVDVLMRRNVVLAQVRSTLKMQSNAIQMAPSQIGWHSKCTNRNEIDRNLLPPELYYRLASGRSYRQAVDGMHIATHWE